MGLQHGVDIDMLFQHISQALQFHFDLSVMVKVVGVGAACPGQESGQGFRVLK